MLSRFVIDNLVVRASLRIFRLILGDPSYGSLAGVCANSHVLTASNDYDVQKGKGKKWRRKE